MHYTGLLPRCLLEEQTHFRPRSGSRSYSNSEILCLQLSPGQSALNWVSPAWLPWLYAARQVCHHSHLISQLLHTICIPYNYKVVFTDRLDLLLRDHHLKSRRKSLRLTKRLYLEYCDKSEGIPYDRLLQGSPYGDAQAYWTLVGVTETEKHRRSMALMDCETEVNRLEAVMPGLNKDVLPNVTHLGVATIYGRYNADLWRRFLEMKEEMSRMGLGIPSLTRAVNLFENRFSSLNIKTACFRNTFGPLSPRPLAPPPENGRPGESHHTTGMTGISWADLQVRPSQSTSILTLRYFARGKGRKSAGY